MVILKRNNDADISYKNKRNLIGLSYSERTQQEIQMYIVR